MAVGSVSVLLIGALAIQPRATSAPPRAAAAAARPAAALRPERLALRGCPRLSPQQLLAYERKGHTVTRALLSPAEAAELGAELRAEHARRLAETRAKILADHGARAAADARAVPFEQLFNLWAANAAARSLAGSERLAQTAAQLLGVRRVRLYQDSLFVKRAGHGETHWHSDCRMAPLETNRLVTAWIALTPVGAEREGGSALVFADGSHRDTARLFWAAGAPTAPIEAGAYALSCHAPFAPGDASWHDGWVLHGAPPNGAREDRWAVAVTFFADGARTLRPAARARMDGEDAPSYEAWLSDLDAQAARGAHGALAAHARLPLVPWEADDAAAPRAEAATPRQARAMQAAARGAAGALGDQASGATEGRSSGAATPSSTTAARTRAGAAVNPPRRR